MSHCLITGITESGKTAVAMQLAKEYRARGIATAVLDPLNDPGWQPDHELCFATRDRAQFLETVRRSRSLAVFVDEAGETVGHFNFEMQWLATRGRHYGHSCHFICQRPKQIAPNVRDQCIVQYIFAVSRNDSKTLAEENNADEIEQAYRLKQYHCFIVRRFQPVIAAKTVMTDSGNLRILTVSKSSAIRREDQ